MRTQTFHFLNYNTAHLQHKWRSCLWLSPVLFFSCCHVAGWKPFFGPLPNKKKQLHGSLLLISLTHRTGTVIIFLFYDRSMALYYKQINTLYCVTSCVATHVPLFTINQRQKKDNRWIKKDLQNKLPSVSARVRGLKK